VSEQRKPLPRDRRGPSQRTVLSDEGVDRGRHLGREGGGATGGLYASVDTGFIGQNVCLFCASEGLATVFRGSVDYPKLARTLKLPDQQFVTFAQTVGYSRA
jgi:nitroreductase